MSHGHVTLRAVGWQQDHAEEAAVTGSDPGSLLDPVVVDAPEPALALGARRYRRDHCVVLALVGVVDATSAMVLRRELSAAVDARREAADRVVVDLSGVCNLDPVGIGELVQAVGRTGWMPRALCLTGASRTVRRVLDGHAVATVCPIFDSVDVAVADAVARSAAAG
jgi:anti-anti-sigma factor